MKCVFIDCFSNYDIRIKPIEEYLNNKGYSSYYITSNFHHVSKQYYSENRKNSIQIKVPKYAKNISLARLMSHFIFSFKAFREVKNIKPDLIYIIIPANSLVWFASRYKRHNNVKVLYDIYDLWPETFPYLSSKRLFSIPFMFWKNLRDKNIKTADFIITECNLYRSKLKNVLENTKTDTLYLAKEYKTVTNNLLLNEEEIHLCYLGSINSIIDIDKIKLIIKAINEKKQTVLHIIGDGENRKSFIDEIRQLGALVEYHGKLYEYQEKQDVFDKCHFGLNIMKDTVCVGLTMKSIDYFQAGLPIINNIKADTEQLIEEYKVGVNITDDNIAEVINNITSASLCELLDMRRNTKKMYEKIFSYEAFNKDLDRIFSQI